MSPEIISRDTKYDGWARFMVVEIRLPGGQIVRREVEHHGNAVAVLAYDPGRKAAILVRQFRAPVFIRSQEPQTLEVIAGIQDEGDSAVTARREAGEEAGLELQSLELVARTWTIPGISTEQMTLYLATYRHSPQNRGPDRIFEEGITVVELALAELDAMMAAGRITDMKTLVLLQALKLRRRDLFDDGGTSEA